MAEFVFNIIVLCLDTVALVACFSIAVSDQAAARYWPLCIFSILFVMLICKLFKLWKKMGSEEKQKFRDLSFLNLKNSNVLRMTIACIASIVYACILPYLGYLVSTLCYGTIMAYLLGGKHIWKNLLASFTITAVLYAIFTWLLGIHPARGVGVFASFSKWLEYLF